MNNRTLVRLRIVLYSLWTLFTAWNTGMAGVKWAAMGWEEQSCLIVGILAQWVGVLVAYFDKSAWRLEEERKNGIDNSNKTPETKP